MSEGAHRSPAAPSRALPLLLQVIAALLSFTYVRVGAQESSSTETVNLGVVALTPEEGYMLEAATRAGLAAGLATSPCAGEAEPAVTVPTVDPDEPLDFLHALCEQSSNGAAAVVLGAPEHVAHLASAAAARSGTPVILVRSTAGTTWEALAMLPRESDVFAAVAALCRTKGWKQAVLLHEGSPRTAPWLAADEHLALTARRLPPLTDSTLLRNTLLLLKNTGETNFIVWCDVECTEGVLRQAQRVGLLSEKHSYILLALDMHTVDLTEYSYGGSNITGIQLFENSKIENVTTAWYDEYVSKDVEKLQEVAQDIRAAPPTSLVLTYDAAFIVASAWCHLRLQQPARAGDCVNGRGALHAGTLLNYVRSREWKEKELSGVMWWDASGTRREVSLTLTELQRGGPLLPVGRWSPGTSFSWNRPDAPPPPPNEGMANRTFTFLIAENKPYIMKKETTERLSINDRYEGYCIELVERLAAQLGFNYTFVVQEDGKYGALVEEEPNGTKKWNGMTRRLMDDPNIDFAITDLTITADRELAVDFTTPFMNLGIGILFRTPTPPAPAVFAFLLPFSNGVWLSLGAAYIITSLVLYVVGRLCPDEWQNPYPCIEEPDVLENQFTLANAFWFNTGAVLLQGSEIAPVAYGTRAVASVWWLFALVITSSYTANLAMLLAKKTSTEVIHDVKELADNQLGILYGAKAGGSTYTFFEHSKSALYQKMYQHMKEHEKEMPNSNDEGIAKVVNENYAFLMESTTIEYTVERNCEVKQVGGLLDSKGYGIAMKKNVSYAAHRQALNLALLNLQERGELRQMKLDWWHEKHGGGACKEDGEHENEELSMANFLGLFYVLVVGSLLGLVWSCVDLAAAARRRDGGVDVPYSRRLWAELRLVFQLEQMSKPPQGAPLLPESPHASHSPPPPAPPAPAAHSPAASLCSASRLRRRSSMHAASLRLARHTRRSSPSNSSSPPQQQHLLPEKAPRDS